ncbi:MAG: hypothetical protein U0904_03245 [Candidatus Nanopelagicales bacterium]|nr:hypothetical protein [Candidatus Nanopelagicales bacterium]
MPVSDAGEVDRPHRETRGRLSRPPVDEDVTLEELDREVRGQLDTLPGSLADLVGGQLVMAARLVDSAPDLALEHAQAARDLAPRVACARESVAVAAYASGDYSLAAREARTVRRMTGDEGWLAVIADCERGLGHPEKALDMLTGDAISNLKPPARAEALIVLSGARADMDQDEAALAVLDDPLLRVRERSEWVARLRFAYAEALLRLGREQEALRWLRLASAGDPEGLTGAGNRLAELEGVEIVDVLDSSQEDEV